MARDPTAAHRGNGASASASAAGGAPRGGPAGGSPQMYFDVGRREEGLLTREEAHARFPAYEARASKKGHYRCDLPHRVPWSAEPVGFCNVPWRTIRRSHADGQCQFKSRIGFTAPSGRDRTSRQAALRDLKRKCRHLESEASRGRASSECSPEETNNTTGDASPPLGSRTSEQPFEVSRGLMKKSRTTPPPPPQSLDGVGSAPATALQAPANAARPPAPELSSLDALAWLESGDLQPLQGASSAALPVLQLPTTTTLRRAEQGDLKNSAALTLEDDLELSDLLGLTAEHEVRADEQAMAGSNKMADSLPQATTMADPGVVEPSALQTMMGEGVRTSMEWMAGAALAAAFARTRGHADPTDMHGLRRHLLLQSNSSATSWDVNSILDAGLPGAFRGIMKPQDTMSVIGYTLVFVRGVALFGWNSRFLCPLEYERHTLNAIKQRASIADALGSVSDRFKLWMALRLICSTMLVAGVFFIYVNTLHARWDDDFALMHSWHAIHATATTFSFAAPIPTMRMALSGITPYMIRLQSRNVSALEEKLFLANNFMIRLHVNLFAFIEINTFWCKFAHILLGRLRGLVYPVGALYLTMRRGRWQKAYGKCLNPWWNSAFIVLFDVRR